MIEAITTFDLKVLSFIHDRLHPALGGFFMAIMKVITHMADSKVCPIYPIIFLAIGIGIYLRRKKENALDDSWRHKFDFAKLGLMMGVALLIGLVICNLILKNAWGRIRPYDVEGYEWLRMIELQSDKSFPSGHTTAVFEMALVITYYCTKKKCAYWGVVAYVMAFIIAFSRLYVGVHYPSDILAGMITGTVSGILAILVVNFIYKKFIDDKIYTPIAEPLDEGEEDNAKEKTEE